MAGGGGPSQPPAWGPAAEDARPAFPAAPGSLGMGSPTPMCLDSPVFTPRAALPYLTLDPCPPPASSSRLLSKPGPHPAHLGTWLPTPLLTLRSPPWTPFHPPSLPSSGLPLAPAGASSHLPRPCRRPPGTARPVTVSASLPGLFSGSSHTGAPAQPIAGAPDVQQQGAPAWDHSPHYGNPAAPALTGTQPLLQAPQLHTPPPPWAPMPAPSRPWLPPQLYSHLAQPLPLALQLTPVCPRPCPVLGPTVGHAAPRLVHRAQPPAGRESLQNLGALGAEHLSWI